MSRKGDCWDNAVAESFFSHLKGRLTEGTTYQNADSLRQDLFVYSDCYYARYRKHSQTHGKLLGKPNVSSFMNSLATLNSLSLFSGQGHRT
jgi:hypothetical protein